MMNTLETLMEWIRLRKAGPSASIFVAFKRSMPGKRENRMLMEQACKEVYTSCSGAVRERLERISANHDYMQVSSDGIAIFCDEHRELVIPLYGVEELFPRGYAAYAGNYLVVHTILPRLQILAHYWVLVLSAQRARIFLGDHGSLEEQTVANFPLDAIPPSDKSKRSYAVGDRGDDYLLHEVERFLRRVDHELRLLLQEVKNLPVIIVAKPELLLQFRTIMQRGSHILVPATIPHDYIHLSSYALRDQLVHAVHEGVEAWESARSSAVVQEFHDMVSARRQALGIQYTWEMIAAGRVQQLLIADDMNSTGALDLQQSAHIYQTDGHGDPLADIFIAHTLQQGGSVCGLRAGMLPAEAAGVGAILRY